MRGVVWHKWPIPLDFLILLAFTPLASHAHALFSAWHPNYFLRSVAGFSSQGR